MVHTTKWAHAETGLLKVIGNKWGLERPTTAYTPSYSDVPNVDVVDCMRLQKQQSTQKRVVIVTRDRPGGRAQARSRNTQQKRETRDIAPRSDPIRALLFGSVFSTPVCIYCTHIRKSVDWSFWRSKRLQGRRGSRLSGGTYHSRGGGACRYHDHQKKPCSIVLVWDVAAQGTLLLSVQTPPFLKYFLDSNIFF